MSLLHLKLQSENFRSQGLIISGILLQVFFYWVPTFLSSLAGLVFGEARRGGEGLRHLPRPARDQMLSYFVSFSVRRQTLHCELGNLHGGFPCKDFFNLIFGFLGCDSPETCLKRLQGRVLLDSRPFLWTFCKVRRQEYTGTQRSWLECIRYRGLDLSLEDIHMHSRMSCPGCQVFV